MMQEGLPAQWMSVSPLRRMDELGGLDNYLLHTPDEEINSKLGIDMKRKIQKTLGLPVTAEHHVPPEWKDEDRLGLYEYGHYTPSVRVRLGCWHDGHGFRTEHWRGLLRFPGFHTEHWRGLLRFSGFRMRHWRALLRTCTSKLCTLRGSRVQLLISMSWVEVLFRLSQDASGCSAICDGPVGLRQARLLMRLGGLNEL